MTRIWKIAARMVSVVATLLALALLAAGVGVAQQQPAAPAPDRQQPPVSFELNLYLVEVPTIVTDADGNFVRGLTEADFEVFEDGERQEVSVFTFVDLPIRLRRPFRPVYATAPVESDVHVTRPTFDGRVYVLMLDDLHTSVFRTQVVQRYARQFVEEHFGENDVAAVVYTSGRSGYGQELTARQSLLLASIDRFIGQKLPSATGERLGRHLTLQMDADNIRYLTDDFTDLADRTITRDYSPDELDEPFEFERAENARRTLEVVKNVAEWMGNVSGRRKAAVLFSEGFDYDIYAPFNRSGSRLIRTTRDAIGAAQRANVSIYAVDARGLMQAPSEAINVTRLSTDPGVRAGSQTGFQNEVLLAQESLIAMAEETGGLAIVSTNDIAGGLDRIVRENSTYYVLGYATDPDKAPGEFRKIEVRVNRPDVRVKARRGFVSPDPSDEPRRTVEGLEGVETSPAFDVALNTPLPVGDLLFRVSAAPFMGTDPTQASVLVILEVDGQTLSLEEVNGLYRGRLDASVVVLDYDGNILGGDNPGVDLNLRLQTYEAVRRHGLRLYSRLALPADARYQVRVGTHASGTGTSSGVPFELVLPDYAQTGFTLSGLVLTSTNAAVTPTPRLDPELAELFPTPPSATRVFHAAERVGLFVELYSSPDSLRRRAEFVTTVRDANDGQTVFTLQDDWTIDPSDEVQAHGYAVEIPLQDLRAGRYVLRAEVESWATGDLVFREVPFEVIED